MIALDGAAVHFRVGGRRWPPHTPPPPLFAILLFHGISAWSVAVECQMFFQIRNSRKIKKQHFFAINLLFYKKKTEW